MLVASIPSPSQGVWHLGPLPIRGYALSIILGIALAIWLAQRRWDARGGRPGAVGDVAIWAVPFGLVGGRLYHVITSPDAYFGEGGHPLDAFAVWKGGLGIWGAIALGAVGAWIACRRLGIPLPAVADAMAPGIVLAQAVGRWGNWFNQELYGKATDLPWGLEIDAAHRPAATIEQATYHPTFLYESLWDLGVAGLVIWADRRFRLGHGRAFALYVAAYTAGRGWIEYLRVDPAEHVLGLRLNVWVSIVVFAVAVIGFVVSARRHPGRETPEELTGVGAASEVSADATESRLGASTATDETAAADRTADAIEQRPGAPPGPE
jgi:prolipoprotein diacylglyceryl transferase